MKTSIFVLSFVLAGNAFGSYSSGGGVICKDASHTVVSASRCDLTPGGPGPVSLLAWEVTQLMHNPDGSMILLAGTRAAVFPPELGSAFALAWSQWTGYLTAPSGTTTTVEFGPQLGGALFVEGDAGYAANRLLLDGKIVNSCYGYGVGPSTCLPYVSELTLPLNTLLTFRVEAVAANDADSTPEQYLNAGTTDTGAAALFSNTPSLPQSKLLSSFASVQITATPEPRSLGLLIGPALLALLALRKLKNEPARDS